MSMSLAISFNDVAAAATILLAVTGLLAWRRRNGRR